MAKLKRRDYTLTSGGWQAYIGPGTLLYATMDGTSLSSSVISLYDSARSSYSDDLISTWTQDTDFGTTVPVACFKDGSVVATLATTSANTKRGVPFADGLFLNKTGDTTHTAALKLLIKPLIKKSIAIAAGTTPDDVSIFVGPGIIHGIRLKVADATVALGTMDLLFKDLTRTLITATNYATAGPKIWSPVTTTGIDDAGSAVTTAATGAYTNEGVAFWDRLLVSTAQASAATQNVQLDVLIEAV
jgi:hypothetical protein